MGIMRRAFYNRLKEEYADVIMTYGYITKNTRIRNVLEKGHAVDARCISGNPKSIPLDAIYMQKAVRKRNRQIHKATINKGGKRKLNQSPKYVHGYQLFDRVQMPGGRKGFIFGRRSSGSFDVRTLDGTKLSAGISCRKLNLLSRRTAILTEKEDMRLPPHA
jgi:N6-L-threonylcarbamoyladenine synthase